MTDKILLPGTFDGRHQLNVTRWWEQPLESELEQYSSAALVFFSIRIGKYDHRYGKFDGFAHTIWLNILSVVLIADPDQIKGI
jgi:hypothetical protein